MSAAPRVKKIAAVGRLAVATLVTAAAGTADAASSSFRLSDPSETALEAVVGRRADGGFVSAWRGFAGAITARRFLADGTPAGAPVLLKPSDGRSATSLRIAVNRRGDFVVTWEGSDENGLEGVNARSFRPDGQLVASVRAAEFRNESSTGSDVAIDDDGDFVIAWRGVRQIAIPILIPYGAIELGSSSVKAQRFTSAGTPIGRVATIATSITDPVPVIGVFEQSAPAVASDGAGNAVVVWGTRDGIGPNAVFARRLSPRGIPQGLAFRVDTRSDAGAYDPDVDMTEDGSSMVVVWQQSHSVGGGGFSGYDVLARRYDSRDRAGPVVAAGDLVLIGGRVSVDMNLAGQAVIAWPATEADFCCLPPVVAMQRLDARGARVGGNQRVSTDYADSAAAAIDEDGSAVVVWSIRSVSPPAVLASLLPLP